MEFFFAFLSHFVITALSQIVIIYFHGSRHFTIISYINTITLIIINILNSNYMIITCSWWPSINGRVESTRSRYEKAGIFPPSSLFKFLCSISIHLSIYPMFSVIVTPYGHQRVKLFKLLISVSRHHKL